MANTTGIYVGWIYNRMIGEVVHKTRRHSTWESAHRAATKLAKRNHVYSDTYKIVVY